ncbi:ankyrin repeat-containing domain protein [Hypomontagnella monticulosa]|nr:ankyrin repeat-containing domain protein [Hypomontagnella monticulosa]
MDSPKLNNLPLEVLHNIATASKTPAKEGDIPRVLDQRDLVNLALVDRRMNAAVIRALYAFDKDFGKSSSIKHAGNSGNFDLLKVAVSYKLDLHSQDKRNRVAFLLEKACEKQNWEMVTWLLDRGTRIEETILRSPVGQMAVRKTSAVELVMKKFRRNLAQDYALYFFSRGANPYFVSKINRHREDLNSEAPFTTALHYAAEKNMFRIVDYLVNTMGLPVDVRDSEGATPLYCAAGKLRKGRRSPKEYHDMSMLQKLMELGADINAETEHRELPLTAAIKSHNFNHAKALLSAGAKVRPANPGPRPYPIHALAAYFPDPLIPVDTRVDHRSMFEILIEAGADLNERFRWGSTPLQSAIYSGTQQTVSLLIELGADPTMKQGNGKGLLDFLVDYLNSNDGALVSNTLGKVTVLVEAGATAKDPTAFLRWLVELCERWGQLSTLHKLLPQLAGQYSDNLNAVLGIYSRKRYNLRYHYSDIIEILVRYGATISNGEDVEWIASRCIHWSPKRSNLFGALRDDIFNTILRMGVPMDSVRKLISAALQAESESHFNLLLAFQPDALSNPDPEWICWAADWGNISVVQRLLDAGADVNTVSISVTPLIQAIRAKKNSCIAMLLSHGADPVLIGKLPLCPKCVGYVPPVKNLVRRDNWIPGMSAFEMAIHAKASLDVIKSLWEKMDPTAMPQPELFLACSPIQPDVAEWLRSIQGQNRD